MDDDELAALLRALDRLPAPQRRALLLREWWRLTLCEVAAELGVSRAEAARLLYRARSGLVRRRRCGRALRLRRA